MASPETLTSSLEQLQKLGLFNGVGDIYLAMMTKEGTETEKPTFTKPMVAAEGVELGLTPVYAEGSQSASNRTVRKVKTLMGYDVRIAYPRMLATIRDYILAHTRDAKGGSVMGDQLQPYVAVGIKETRDDGTCSMRWIYKVRFNEQNVDAKTAEEGTIAYQIPVLEGSAVRCNTKITPSDGSAPFYPAAYAADTGDESCTWTEETFFADVPWYTAEGAAAAQTN